MEKMHLFDTQADEEKALCGTNVPVHDLTGVDYYLERRKDGLPVGTVCEPCKDRAVQWGDDRCLKLEADTRDLRADADRQERMANDRLAKANDRRRLAEEAESDAVRYRNGAERRRSEADGLEDEADECRRVADILARETGLTCRRG